MTPLLQSTHNIKYQLQRQLKFSQSIVIQQSGLRPSLTYNRYLGHTITIPTGEEGIAIEKYLGMAKVHEIIGTDVYNLVVDYCPSDGEDYAMEFLQLQRILLICWGYEQLHQGLDPAYFDFLLDDIAQELADESGSELERLAGGALLYLYRRALHPFMKERMTLMNMIGLFLYDRPSINNICEFFNNFVYPLKIHHDDGQLILSPNKLHAMTSTKID